MNRGEILRELLLELAPRSRGTSKWLRWALERAGERVTERQAYQIVYSGKAPARLRAKVKQILRDAHDARAASIGRLRNDLDRLFVEEAGERATLADDLVPHRGDVGADRGQHGPRGDPRRDPRPV
jgi:hypothetical protein